jgi:tRNA U34 5-methylaminomethyl-2-thiouridine-forming methyltransferase MnmC
LKREIIQTDDGSTTIRLPDWDECYHSTHGAIQEAYHVFIKHGFAASAEGPISIMEIGFGTGLNAFITFLEADKTERKVDYVGIEAYPVSPEEVSQLNYVSQLNAEMQNAEFQKMHASLWEQQIEISANFTLTKRKQFFSEIDYKDRFDLIYFDAFGYGVQPELWSTDIFRIMYRSLKNEGKLVTYAARSVIKRSMQEVGFRVEKLEGAPGKREMFRAFKD